MTLDEYERSKGRLVEQRRNAMELVEAGYQAQLRALELYWTLQSERGEEAQPAAPPSGPAVTPTPVQSPPPREEPAPRRSASEVDWDVRQAFPLFPDTFTRHDACRALGYVPHRGALYVSLQKLVQEGFARVFEQGSGHRAVVYQKTGAGDPPLGE